MRIVSLVPSLTETLCDLGYQDRIVGCTQFCVEPKNLHRTAQLLGGTKDFNRDELRALNPTHVFCNQEENPKDAVEDLMRDTNVLLTFPRSPHDVPAMLRDMGQFLGDHHLFRDVAVELEDAMQTCTPLPPRRYLYFIWQNPYMIAGHDTYISRFLEAWGWTNACPSDTRYPAIEIDDIRHSKPDMLLFSSEPFPFRKRDADRLRESMPDCPSIHKIDGQMLSWFGTRTLAAWKMMEKIRREELPPL